MLPIFPKRNARYYPSYLRNIYSNEDQNESTQFTPENQSISDIRSNILDFVSKNNKNNHNIDDKYNHNNNNYRINNITNEIVFPFKISHLEDDLCSENKQDQYNFAPNSDKGRNRFIDNSSSDKLIQKFPSFRFSKFNQKSKRLSNLSLDESFDNYQLPKKFAGFKWQKLSNQFKHLMTQNETNNVTINYNSESAVNISYNANTNLRDTEVNGKNDLLKLSNDSHNEYSITKSIDNIDKQNIIKCSNKTVNYNYVLRTRSFSDIHSFILKDKSNTYLLRSKSVSYDNLNYHQNDPIESIFSKNYFDFNCFYQNSISNSKAYRQLSSDKNKNNLGTNMEIDMETDINIDDLYSYRSIYIKNSLFNKNINLFDLKTNNLPNTIDNESEFLFYSSSNSDSANHNLHKLNSNSCEDENYYKLFNSLTSSLSPNFISNDENVLSDQFKINDESKFSKNLYSDDDASLFLEMRIIENDNNLEYHNNDKIDEACFKNEAFNIQDHNHSCSNVNLLAETTSMETISNSDAFSLNNNFSSTDSNNINQKFKEFPNEELQTNISNLTYNHLNKNSDNLCQNSMQFDPNEPNSNNSSLSRNFLSQITLNMSSSSSSSLASSFRRSTRRHSFSDISDSIQQTSGNWYYYDAGFRTDGLIPGRRDLVVDMFKFIQNSRRIGVPVSPPSYDDVMALQPIPNTPPPNFEDSQLHPNEPQALNKASNDHEKDISFCNSNMIINNDINCNSQLDGNLNLFDKNSAALPIQFEKEMNICVSSCNINKLPDFQEQIEVIDNFLVERKNDLLIDDEFKFLDEHNCMDTTSNEVNDYFYKLETFNDNMNDLDENQVIQNQIDLQNYFESSNQRVKNESHINRCEYMMENIIQLPDNSSYLGEHIALPDIHSNLVNCVTQSSNCLTELAQNIVSLPECLADLSQYVPQIAYGPAELPQLITQESIYPSELPEYRNHEPVFPNEPPPSYNEIFSGEDQQFFTLFNSSFSQHNTDSVPQFLGGDMNEDLRAPNNNMGHQFLSQRPAVRWNVNLGVERWTSSSLWMQ